MTTVKFLQDCRVKDHRMGSDQAETYRAGQVVSLTDGSAQHWINRGKAVICDPVPPPAPKPAPLPAVTEEQVEETRAEMEKPAEEPPAWRRPPDRRKR